MSPKNNTVVRLVVLMATLPIVSLLLCAEVQKQIYHNSKGLNVTFLQDNSMDYIHAEIVIFYNEIERNPAVPYLTMMNIFNDESSGQGSPVTSQLKKMGNDYSIEQTPEYLLLKINLLPDRVFDLAHLIKLLFKFTPFLDIKVNPDAHSYLKRTKEIDDMVKRSIASYWYRFYQKENWKNEIAHQIGYNVLFSNAFPGNGLVTQDHLRSISIEKLRAFYKRTYRFPNSLVVIKGNLKPHLLRGALESELVSFPRQVPLVPVDQKLLINNSRKVVIFNIETNDPPILYWFDAIEPMTHPNYIPRLAVNNILFGYPLGRLYSRTNILGNDEIKQEVMNHRQVSVICNSIQLRVRDIENFINAVDIEKQRLFTGRGEKTEILKTFSFFYGKIKVDSRHVDNDINREIMTALAPQSETYYKAPPLPSQLVQVTQDVMAKTDDPAARGVIVIVGNAALILRYLKEIKPTILNSKK